MVAVHLRAMTSQIEEALCALNGGLEFCKGENMVYYCLEKVYMQENCGNFRVLMLYFHLENSRILIVHFERGNFEFANLEKKRKIWDLFWKLWDHEKTTRNDTYDPANSYQTVLQREMRVEQSGRLARHISII